MREHVNSARNRSEAVDTHFDTLVYRSGGARIVRGIKKRPEWAVFSLGVFRGDVDEHALMQFAIEPLHFLGKEVHDTGSRREEGVVIATLYVLSWVEFRTALADED